MAVHFSSSPSIFAGVGLNFGSHVGLKKAITDKEICCGMKIMSKSKFQCCQEMPWPRDGSGKRCCNTRMGDLIEYLPSDGEKFCTDTKGFGEFPVSDYQIFKKIEFKVILQ